MGATPKRDVASGSAASNKAAAQAGSVAKDRLARTAQSINAVRSMQAKAGARNVPNGLQNGGLKVLTGPNARWDGAAMPVQSGNKVTVKQQNPQAMLHWETFNVGRETTLYFDQTAGKADAGKWIAFNKVFDPAQKPSEILGSIKAEGQVYVLNQNGVIFGAGSQVNVRTLVASALPINDNLVANGLLNNRDAQFLFSGLTVPGGADGTPAFIPPTPPSSGRYGDIVVESGAFISSAANTDGNGGRVMLVGANVKNAGVISTPSGQTVLAAGLQVAVDSHNGNDPSLRGLDVWVGDVGTYAGAVINSGLIESQTGSIMMVGRSIEQLGALDSSTSVNLNGRIDLLASYGAVGNPNFDNTGGGGPPFLSQFTGSVKFGPSSVTRILPDYYSGKKVPGLSLPESSQVNVYGQTINVGQDATILATSGKLLFMAGSWAYKDTNANGIADEAALNLFYESRYKQRFVLDNGQIVFETGSLVDVSGSTGAFVPLAQNVVQVQLRGSELADSPLLRNSALRGLPLTVDLRRYGFYLGRQWVGTPLGDLNGLAGIIERDAAQLTAQGGTIDLQAGTSIKVNAGATLDVSGGHLIYEGGGVKTSRLLRGNTLIDIDNATPDVLYDGVYEGRGTKISQKWGIARTYANPLAPMGGYSAKSYVEGAAGGTMSFTAPMLSFDGELLGRTLTGPQQLDAAAKQGSLLINFRGQQTVMVAGVPKFIQHSPTPPVLTFVEGASSPGSATAFSLGIALFDPEKGGFGNLTIDNRDGDVIVPQGTKVQVPPGGSLVVQAANISLEESIRAPGGRLDFIAYNYSPYTYQLMEANGGFAAAPAPLPVVGRGSIRLAPGKMLDVSGMAIDERTATADSGRRGIFLDGGTIALEGYSVSLGEGSLLNADGGRYTNLSGRFAYGNGGDISVLAGKDPVLSTTIGGTLSLGGEMRAYSFATGGSLTIQANLIQIGGVANDSRMLLLQPEFFRTGGFTNYSLIGIGGRDGAGEYIPAIRLTAGTILEPASASPIMTRNGVAHDLISMRSVGLRTPTSISLTGIGSDDAFVPLGGLPDLVDALGYVVIEQGSTIRVDPEASVRVSGDAVGIFGSIIAPGGLIDIAGDNTFRLSTTQRSQATFALPTVHIGSTAVLSTAGTSILVPDPYGRRAGTVYAGGEIRVAGNIVAESGAVLDVSGISEVLDFHPTRLGLPAGVPQNAGINSTPWGIRTVPVRVDTDGGRIALVGGEMLYSDATLYGTGGGPTAFNGSLSVSSGRFYNALDIVTSEDINMIVEQTGSAAQFGATAAYGKIDNIFSGRTNLAAAFLAGGPNAGMGYFAVDQFVKGGFDSLDLNYYLGTKADIPLGGNVEFRGPVSVGARAFLRVAGGGIIRSNSTVDLAAPYVAIGREFLDPLNPNDIISLFRTTSASGPVDYFPQPTYGTGTLTVNASLIDVGTLVLGGIGTATLTSGGDIRGNGILNISGDLTMKASQIYPTTLSKFDIFAYDRGIRIASASASSPVVTLASAILPTGFGIGSPLLGSVVQNINGTQVTLAANANMDMADRVAVYAPGSGSVTILGGGQSAPPLSAGGSLGIYASTITQSGNLQAPMGAITLGWDGLDLDPSDADIDQPQNLVTGPATVTPVTQLVTLSQGSITSVSGINPQTGQGVLVPFGISEDGLTWTDPQGVNVSITDLPQRKVSILGNSLVTEAGSLVDLRGGGDLFAYRWVPGTGGSTDLLGTAAREWSGASSVSYAAGDLVTYGGQTWSARVAIDHASFTSPPSPGSNRYWTLVPESYAIVPGFDASFAPFNTFNTALGDDPGYVAASLAMGDRIYLGASPGLKAGTYTLLPRRYALLPGAFLVTPQATGTVSGVTTAEGASYVAGYRFNAFQSTKQVSPLRDTFEVAPPAVLAERVQYDLYTANQFMMDAALRADIVNRQPLPMDAGHFTLSGNSVLNLAGGVLAGAAQGGRGARADIASVADMYIVGGSGTAPGGAGVVLSDALLSSWGIESLLLGGMRYETTDGAGVQVRTNNITLDNPGSSFISPEISLVSKSGLHVASGSSVASSGVMTMPAETLLLTGDGTALRVSTDINAAFSRTSVPSLNTPLMTIGSGAAISGMGVILDSTYGTNLDSSAELIASALTLGSGQISVVLSDPPGGLTGTQVNPHLILAGDALQLAERSSILTLQSYRTIDIYGVGEFGSPILESLRLLGGGVRGFDQGGGTATILAENILFSNPTNVAGLAAPPGVPSGMLAVSSESLHFGLNAFSVLGYQQLNVLASGGVYVEGSGSFSTAGALTIAAPRVSAAQGVNHAITASGGGLNLVASIGAATVPESGLGATLSFTGTAVNASLDIYLPSGSLTLKATTGNLTVGGRLSVEGSAKEFYDLTRYADAGQITLAADQGSVAVQNGAEISVAAHQDGGDAGTLIVKTPLGSFNSLGTLLGQGGTDGLNGSFEIDAFNLASFSALTNELNAGGFTESRTLRVRSGDVTVTGTTRARHFTLSTDLGSIYVAGIIDASGRTGGSISLMARNDVELQSGSILNVHGQGFSNAGKGGEINLEAGTIDASGTPNTSASVRILAGSTIDLGVDGFAAGAYTDPNASAFYGNFTGTLHIRAPRVGSGVNVGALGGTIIDPSAIIVEAYRVYDRTAFGGTVDSTLRNQMHADNLAFMTAGEASIRSALLAGISDPVALAVINQALVVAPGVEIINRNGDLLLGTPGNATGTNPAEDWDLSSYRYGSRQAAGILTMRASGNLVFRNALSDGFAGFTPQQGAPQAGLRLWLANLMAINDNLPINAQSWSYRLTAGADLSAANYRSVRDVVPVDSGSLQLGNFYATNLFSNTAAAGQTATTAAAISPSGTTTRYQVIRTGTGDIDISTAADVQLRNQFASIYTAGVRVPDPTQIFSPGDFSVPSVQPTSHPNQTALGAVQQIYPAQWSMAGGNVSVHAVADIRRITQVTVSGVTSIVTDTSRQIPTNWLYRRGYVDQSGAFGVGGVDSGFSTINDPSASTAWWIDYSNFFQGFGALGGGDVSLVAGRDIINADAFIPTNARMAGLSGGVRIAPNADNLLEYGGGDLLVQAGRNIDGGSYYVERGNGYLVAGGEVKTNGARSPSLGYIGAPPASYPDDILTSRNPAIYDPLTWLPTMLYLGRGSFDVTARGNVLIGPVANPSLMPQGLNNKYWYKTYFQTYGEDSAVTVTSLGGDVTHRLSTAVPGTSNSRNILQAWIEAQNFYSSSGSTTRASNTQPWIRAVETSIAPFATSLSVGAPNLFSTSFSGDVNIAGSMNLFPSATGTIELAAAEAIIGLNPVGRITTGTPARSVFAWTAGRINLSDANPNSIYGITNPFAYQALVGRSSGELISTRTNFLSAIDRAFNETGSITGAAAAVESKRALHDVGILHANDISPAKLYAAGGDISGLIFYSAKFASIVADNDVTDVALYIQNVGAEDISLVSAGRDVVPYNENSAIRSVANNLASGNLIVDLPRTTVVGSTSRVLSGDIQISGPGFLEVLAGRNIDLGTGPNYADGTGTGITSIGNARNPFLPFDGASLIVLAGVGGVDGGAALGLGDSTLDIEGFLATYLSAATLPGVPLDFDSLTGERRNIAALDIFFALLRQSGDEAALTGDYELGYAAIAALFGKTTQEGEIFTRARDIRTASGGSITVAAPAGGLTMASDIFGNPLTPPGIVTAYGGAVSVFTQGDVDIGQARIFTLRGGDITMWSSTGDIAAGSAPKTVVTAPPTRVLIDATSADIQTDLGGLATGGGIGTLKIREDAEPSNVYLIAPEGTVDAGDAGIRATGNVTIAAVQVLNADNIAAGGSAVGVPTTTVVAAPNIGSLTSASSTTGATSSAATKVADQSRPKEEEDSAASIFSVEVLGYGGGEDVGSVETERGGERVLETSPRSDSRIVHR